MIEFHTLGKIDLDGVGDEDTRAVLRAPKRLGFLSYLALAGRGRHVRRDTLVTLLWPDRDASRARHALRNTLYELRQALGGEVVHGRGKQELAVDPNHLRCDAVAFREALAAGRREAALDLYGGDLLPGLHVGGAAPAFEQWLTEERRELRHEARRAATELSHAAEEDGRTSDAARWERRSLGLDPFDEGTLRRLMRLLARSGNRAAALRAYEDFADRLERRLGLEPDTETRELHREIGAAGAGTPGGDRALRATSGGSGAPAERLGSRVHVRGERDAESGRAQGSTPVGDEPPASAESSGEVRRPAWRNRGVVVAAVLFVAAAVWGIGTPPWSVNTAGDEAAGSAVASLSGERLAVFPFRVRGDAELRSVVGGLAGLLATGLDGAGGLRTVDPRALASRAEEMPDPLDTEAASEVAESLDAGLYVVGEAFASGAATRITAALYRPGSSTPISRSVVEGPRERVLRLIDDLAARLLTSAYPEVRLRLVRQAGRTTGSLEALKAYLTGEQEFRSGRFPAASEAYQRAVALDTAFALAHHRLSVTSEWLGNRELARVEAESAVRHSDRLAERDRRLLEAHLTSLQGDAEEAERQYRTLLAIWPHDLEAWYQLGEILFHYGPAVGRSISEARGAFGRVRSLHPTHVPSLVHLARIAATEARVDELGELADRVESLVPESHHAWEMRALTAFLAERPSRRAEVVEGLRNADGESVRRAVWSVAVFAGELDAARRLAALMTDSERSPEIRALGGTWEAQLELARGRWRAALGRLAEVTREGTRPQVILPRTLVASLGILPLPDSVLRGERRRLRQQVAEGRPEGGRASTDGLDGPAPVGAGFERFGLALLCSRVGDFEAALSGADELESRRRDDAGSPLAGRFGRIVRAHVAWRRGDAERALELLGSGTVDTRSAYMYGTEFVQPFERYLRARVLTDLGRTEEALRWFDSFADQHVSHLVYLAPSHMHRARLLEGVRRPVQAAGHYRNFLELWERPDPELRPLRRAAELRLEELEDASSSDG